MTAKKTLPSFLLLLFVASLPPTFAHVDISTKGDYRYIKSDGIPNHSVGAFPNDHNPNSISQQNYDFRVTLHPAAAEQPTPLGMQDFGVGLNGVPFDPSANEFWNRDRSSGWQYEALSGHMNLGMDMNNAHVQPNGAYHYHGLPTGLINNLGDGTHMLLIGWAADGFPIYEKYGYSEPNNPKSRIKEMKSSYRLKPGSRPSGPGGAYDGTFVQDFEYKSGAGDLDECNGHFGVSPEFPKGTYCYFITADFPFIPRFWKGTADESFQRKGPGGRGNRRGGQFGGPPGGQFGGPPSGQFGGPPGGQFGGPPGGQFGRPPGGEGGGPPGGRFGGPPGSEGGGPPGGQFGGPPGGEGGGPPGGQFGGPPGGQQ